MTTISMDQTLLAVLQVHNPWLTRPNEQARLLAESLPRGFVARRRQLDLTPGRAELVIGPRQAGKSTWIRHDLTQRPEPVLILHADEPVIRELCVSPALALQALAGLLSERTVLFLEEVQQLPDAALFIKGLVDLQPHRRIVATGSASFQMQARTRESLAGRARRTLLLPFSLAEALSAGSAAALPALEDARRSAAWARMVVFGGYPRAWLSDDAMTELRYLLESFVLRDASDLQNIENPAAFRRLLELCAADVGSLSNQSAWAGHAAVSRDTVARYLFDIAADAHVLRPVPPFVGGKRAEITGTPKVYFLDPGLRNAIFGGFAPEASRGDRGSLWENAVFSELAKQIDLLDTIQYWRSKNGAEVDFVVSRAGRLVGVEVKASALVRPQLSRSAQSFIEAYEPSRFAVINASLTLDWESHGVPVVFRRPWEIGEVLGSAES